MPYLPSLGGEIMSLPVYIPYLEAIKFLLMVGAVGVVATSAGALLRAWSWKIPQTLGLAFLGIIAAFVAVAWLYGQFVG
jgi:hypothetical protein